ncbi:hypothetical protein ACS0TY_006824 [Phlomoides rotata]
MEKGKSTVMLSQVDQIDPTKVRILLCDLDAQSCQEILALLCKCSYQVAAVWSATQVVDTLNTQGPRAHIILADVNLLMANDARIMRHIMRDHQLQHIPLFIITRQDQVSITIKGLRLGAADYLVKPLQHDELSSLWKCLQH